MLCFINTIWYFWGNLTLFCLFHFNIISSFWKWQMDFFGAALGISTCITTLNTGCQPSFIVAFRMSLRNYVLKYFVWIFFQEIRLVFILSIEIILCKKYFYWVRVGGWTQPSIKEFSPRSNKRGITSALDQTNGTWTQPSIKQKGHELNPRSNKRDMNSTLDQTNGTWTQPSIKQMGHELNPRSNKWDMNSTLDQTKGTWTQPSIKQMGHELNPWSNKRDMNSTLDQTKGEWTQPSIKQKGNERSPQTNRRGRNFRLQTETTAV